MDYPKVLFLALATVLGSSHGAFVDTLMKCKLADSECHKLAYQNSLNDVAENGIPEFGVDPLDPIQLKDVKVSILNIIDFKLLEGTVKGLKSCVFNEVQRNMEKSIMTIDLTCDIVVNGKYELRVQNEDIKKLFGGDIHGDGNGGVEMEQVNVKMEFPISVKKRDDDLYIIGDFDKTTNTIDVLGKMTFAADNLYIGDKESSSEIITMLNQNWKSFLSTYGNSFFNIAINHMSDFIKNLNEKIPAKNYILDDLTPYLS